MSRDNFGILLFELIINWHQFHYATLRVIRSIEIILKFYLIHNSVFIILTFWIINGLMIWQKLNYIQRRIIENFFCNRVGEMFHSFARSFINRVIWTPGSKSDCIHSVDGAVKDIWRKVNCHNRRHGDVGKKGNRRMQKYFIR